MTVHLVGAGPGDPGLLTLRADDLLRRCDCIVYDYLVNPAILDRVPAGAHRIYVGKRGHEDSISQDEINQRLVACARRFHCVVRLKGGDPFLFGRGGEEADHLAAAGIPFQIVPGVTSGVAVPAYAGIPITHRAKSSAVVFATGHRKPGAEDEAHWQALARIETIVLYMGMQKLGDLCAALIRHGRAPGTPACVIQWGTYARQRSATGTLADIATIAAEAGLGSPAITVIGDVVGYRDRIRWFDRRPLSGRRVLVTRSRTQASALVEALEALGAETVGLPLSRQVPPECWDAVDAASDALPEWTAFASTNAVDAFCDRLSARGRDLRALARTRIAAIGASTAERLALRGIRADLIPDRAHGQDLAAALIAAGATAVLLPQADNATALLRQRLESAGVAVTAVVVYRSIPETAVDVDAIQDIDAVTFASSATARRFAEALGADRLRDLLATGCRCYAIGAETAATMGSLGLPVHAIAATPGVEALAAAVAADLGPG